MQQPDQVKSVNWEHSDASSQQRRSPGYGELRFRRFLAEAPRSKSTGRFAEDVKSRPSLAKGQMNRVALGSLGFPSEGIAARRLCTVTTVNSYLTSAARRALRQKPRGQRKH